MKGLRRPLREIGRRGVRRLRAGASAPPWLAGPWEALCGRTLRVSIGECVNPLGFSYAPSGWHYYTELLREMDRRGGPEGAIPAFERFYDDFDHPRLAALMGREEERGWPDLPALLLPWDDAPAALTRDDVHQCGPRSPGAIRADAEGMWALYQAFRTHGYRPAYHRDGYVRGVLLLRRDGDRRFVVTGGQHRAAILSHLGVPTVRVRLEPARPAPVLREEEAGSWAQVSAGRWGERAAREFFDLLFTLDGRERAPGSARPPGLARPPGFARPPGSVLSSFQGDRR